MCARRSFVSSVSDIVVMSLPAISTVPSVGWSRPASRCISVDLPEPDGPMTATSSPCCTSSETPREGVDGGVARAVAAGQVAGGDDRLQPVLQHASVGQFDCCVLVRQNCGHRVPLFHGLGGKCVPGTLVQSGRSGIALRLDSASSVRMISAYAVGMTRPVPVRVTVVPVQAVFDRIRARALEALVLTFALASLVEAGLAHGIERRARRGRFGPRAGRCRSWRVDAIRSGRRSPSAPRWSPSRSPAGLSTNNLTMPFVAAVMASVSFGLISDRRQSVAGWSAVVAAAAVVDYQTTAAFSDFFWTTLILTLAWFFGVALGTRTEQARELRLRVEAAERDRALATERATAEERSRIARELHDVVAHSVSVMVVQASGVRRLLKDDQEREREALVSVEQIGRAGADRDATYVGRHARRAKTSLRLSRRSPGCSISTG